MGENLDNLQQNQQTHQSSSRLSSRSLGGGQIVQVQGGHIIRSTGLKDRHSKVCTAKGPRDRRVRLSATTAIQFYDVQDRLGYDRPSKAVDWLIKNSKAAIDELGELPPWDPTSYLSGNSNFPHEQAPKQQEICGLDVEPASKRPMKRMVGGGMEGIHNGSSSSFSFLPPSLNSNSIADTIKSFFPVGGSTAEEHSSNMQFQSFPPSDFLSRTSGQSQDLRLSLQSFQDPIFLHQHNQQAQHQASTCNSEQVQAQIQAHANALFSRANHLGFDASGWSEHQQPAEIGRLQRLAAWNQCGDAANSGGGFLFTSQPMQQQQQQPLLQQLIGQNQLLSQRGPLQSSNTPSIRAWIDRSSLAISEADNIQHHQTNQAVFSIHPSSISGIGLASGGGRFSDFRNTARIPGEEEEHGGFSDKPSSASSGSRH